MPKGAGENQASTAVLQTSTCPWKKTEPIVNSTSFRELMDGDLAQKLQTEEEMKYQQELK